MRRVITTPEAVEHATQLQHALHQRDKARKQCPEGRHRFCVKDAAHVRLLNERAIAWYRGHISPVDRLCAEE